MSTKRTRVIHQRKNMSNTALYYASDGLWGDPEDLSLMEKFTSRYRLAARTNAAKYGLRSARNFYRNGLKSDPDPDRPGGICLIPNAHAYQPKTFSAKVGRAVTLQKTSPICGGASVASAIRHICITR